MLGSLWDAAQGARRTVVSFTTSGLQRGDALKATPARRVAVYSGVCGVVKLANGTTIRRTLRPYIHPEYTTTQVHVIHLRALRFRSNKNNGDCEMYLAAVQTSA